MAISTSTPTGVEGERWRSYRWAAWFLRAFIFLAPLAAALAMSLWLGPRLFVPRSAPAIVAWWICLAAASALAAWAVDRLARRLLPLTVMLKMTMLFPDQAPSRFRVALRSSNLGELRRQVAAARNGDGDPSEVAGLILSLASALNDYDRRLRGHGERTRAYADMLAAEMKVPADGRDKLRWAALLHDIGKIEIPAEILGKDGPLDPDEKAIVKRHPLLGMRVAAPLVPWLGEWARAIEDHHEWWDGSGYPRGLRGTEIALGARIVAVADSYDVMTTGRPYQPARSADAARREVARMSGTQFDPEVARALMSIALGRLRWLIGPAAWLGQVPFFLERLGRDFVTVTTAAAVTAASVVGGMVTLPALAGSPSSPMAAAATDTTVVEAAPGTPGGRDGPASTDATGDSSADGEEVVPADGGTVDPVGGIDEEPNTTTSSPTTTPPSTTATTAPDPTTTPTTTVPPPTAHDDAASTQEEKTVTIDVISNDSPSGLALSAITDPPSSGDAVSVSGRVRYTPDTDFNGTDTFRYEACDGSGRCSTATVAVGVSPVNDAPTASADSATADAGKAVTIRVLDNDTDVDGDSLKVAAAGSPSLGSAVTNGAVVTYTPAAGTSGTDTFTYRVCDPSGECDTATVSVNVRAVARPPNAVDDVAYYHPGGKTGTVAVLANDSHPDGTALDPSSVVVITPPHHGEIVSINGGVIRYRMDKGTTTPDSFVYRVCDVKGLCDTATVTLLKNP
ncbi:MAG TPA: Ig-like domain-containing protein [Acidimicrobiia bacterium]|nr:Ig-like domain-containing protein [Acidimicrobiia bacterium]